MASKVKLKPAGIKGVKPLGVKTLSPKGLSYKLVSPASTKTKFSSFSSITKWNEEKITLDDTTIEKPYKKEGAFQILQVIREKSRGDSKAANSLLKQLENMEITPLSNYAWRGGEISKIKDLINPETLLLKGNRVFGGIEGEEWLIESLVTLAKTQEVGKIQLKVWLKRRELRRDLRKNKFRREMNSCPLEQLFIKQSKSPEFKAREIAKNLCKLRKLEKKVKGTENKKWVKEMRQRGEGHKRLKEEVEI